MKSLNLETQLKHTILIVITCFCLAAAGCVSREFSLGTLAKSDVDQIADIHLSQTLTLLKKLTRKLYLINSSQLVITPGATIDSQISRIFQCPPLPPGPETHQQQSSDAILLGFAPQYQGDRVHAVMYGLYTMLHTAYNEKCGLYMMDFLDAQNLYNAARNIEILVWRLKTRHRPDGSLYLTTNSCEGPVQNLSFERTFGKLIALQDTMALIAQSRGDRLIKEVVHMAGMAFLPVGIAF